MSTTVTTPAPAEQIIKIHSAKPSFFGTLTGSPAEVSVGLTNEETPKITNVVVLAAGTVVEYSAAAAGTVTFVASSVTPPPAPATILH